ncbi:phage tail protein [Agrobacterium sp. fls2-241-TYG-188a]|uniref:phage tail protein n=1 Tax=Agrobacterium sp. fls2-241-TYG-188a TaxID=3040275 RepID=UPI002550C6FC|nr:phage tail protein [Agrobacterium sp. fls2-241-TYG-188a]
MTLSKQPMRHLLAGITSLGMITGWGATLGTVAIVSATPAAACDYESYTGTICTFAFDWCPDGYVRANGQLLSTTRYNNLYSLIGTLYGGYGSGYFAVPDLTGRAVLNKGGGPGLAYINLSQKVGHSRLALDISQVPLKPHVHTATFTGSGGGTTQVTVPPSAGSLGITATLSAVQTPGIAQPRTGSLLGMGGSGNQAATIYVPSNSTATQVQLGGLDVKLTGSAGNGQIAFNVPTGITGGTIFVAPAQSLSSEQVSIQSPGMGMTVCIVTDGIYPSRP